MKRLTCLFSSLFLLAACNRAASESNSAAAPATSAPAVTASAGPASTALAKSGELGRAPSAEAKANCEASGLLSVGCLVPDVAAPAQDGRTVRLRELTGKPLVVYFYPKDDTPGCTVEAKGIRENYAELTSRAVVLGVSTDDSASHKAFAEKYDLPFRLLDDSSHALVTAFGVPVSYGHAERVTFVIDAAGEVRKVFPNVNPDGHAQQLIEALKAL